VFRNFIVKQVDKTNNEERMFDILLKIFHLNGDVAISGEGLQNLNQCSTLMSFELGGIFIVP
jgi:hypothetical protein